MYNQLWELTVEEGVMPCVEWCISVYSIDLNGISLISLKELGRKSESNGVSSGLIPARKRPRERRGQINSILHNPVMLLDP